ncbi:accessory Sec system translocase SecA2 [Microbacterium kribbense]|uniref:Protein translocase subunit SecA n=1 Tax=Microbacterium kribbense TaxID=433645 RepID=A0ABP7GTT1_9MICO
MPTPQNRPAVSGAGPTWLRSLLGLPGAASLRAFTPLVRAAHGRADEARALDADALRSSIRALALRTGSRALPREPTARFLALAREAAARTLGLAAFDGQLLACCALLSGTGVEMDTGEGKTLVGALAAAGHVVAGRHVHVISVNDYLAERDAQWMGPLFAALGITVGWVGQHTPHAARRDAYRCDVVYAPVSEIGFDVLRDRFATDAAGRVDPHFDAAIVDEADAVMIDEATVPLVLAGTADDAGEDFTAATQLVADLREQRDYTVADDQTTAVLTDAGLDLIEARLGGVNLFAGENVRTLTRINLALHARTLMRRDVDYLVSDGQIRLINSARGRIAHLQRWPDGLQAAIEAKEGLAATAAGQVLDTVTVQSLLGGYRTLSGMSGTMLAVAEDLLEFYQLPVGRIPRHEPNIRIDEPDRILLSRADAQAAIDAEVARRHASGQPLLVGTQSVAESEALAARLDRAGIRTRVLNAKHDADEAAIIARAGEYAAVTISTQMSGRGTDIRLGGADERDRARVAAVGGLAVIATGRYPTGRLDAQLRGRCGRQGDPGTTIAFASLADDLVTAHAPAFELALVARAGDALAASARQRIVDGAQRIAEGIRLDRHRNTWGYNRAIARQRATVLAHRDEVIAGDLAERIVHTLIPEHLDRLRRAGVDAAAGTVRAAALSCLDTHWTDQLGKLQEIRDGIHLRAIAGQNPVDEFHTIALREFDGFFDQVYADVAAFLQALVPEEIGQDIGTLGLRRPAATWTYMVTDDPFGSPGDRAARHLGALVRTKLFHIE